MATNGEIITPGVQADNNASTTNAVNSNGSAPRSDGNNVTSAGIGDHASSTGNSGTAQAPLPGVAPGGNFDLYLDALVMEKFKKLQSSVKCLNFSVFWAFVLSNFAKFMVFFSSSTPVY
jgi:hypothetical protein